MNKTETRHFINHTCHRFWYLSCRKCNAHYGRLSSSYLLHRMGHSLYSISDRRILLSEENNSGTPEDSDPFSNGRSLRLCFICAENSICHRKQLSYDRNRTWCDLVRTMCHRNFRTDRPPISGSTSRSRRSYDTWSKYIFHGNRRSASDIWNL